MKKWFLHSVVLVLSLSLIVSCSTNEDDSTNTTVEIEQLESTAETGTWRVTNLVDSGQDETSDFNGFVFSFLENGTVTATNGTTIYDGTWSVASDDDDDNDVDFNIFFPVPDSNDFDDLNDDWDIVSYSDTIINLIDIDDETGDTDLLTFEKD